ncbi:restriction endonuclease [Corynebacterium uterequi]|uniref:Restriction endonuclease n=1 Tax=Corynebacterium uterequi TaxID=1072256 RepID=A0A0G3HF47_9CORY|nr:restriction endonuclease [Corynebacterium uterequi]AKK11976.1 restriction endonuclease [Corynebacterium uterequi]
MTEFATPPIDQFRPAVLAVLADGTVRGFRELAELAAAHLGLTEEAKAEKLSSGQLRYINRLYWACSSLVHAGLVRRPQRAHYRITDDGLVVAARNLRAYSEKDLLEWQPWSSYKQELRNRTSDSPAGADTSHDEDTDPVEALIAGQQAYNARTETELRTRLQAASPEFFEKAVLDLLWAMGYGGAHGEKQHVGRSGDGGIDGIISQDALGLSNIYIQAKKYADNNKVGDREIRNFMGSLDARGATLGVFITTSAFLPRAETSARSYRHGKIVLIDGIRLTRLMLNYGVAVNKFREFALYEIDDDYFDEELG